MKLSSILSCVVVSIVTSLAVVHFQPKSQSTQEQDSAFARVMRTGTLRCGYYVFPPVMFQDPNTKELSGYTVDFMNRLADRMKIKIEWTEEVTFGNWVPALQSRRFDAVCAPMWPELAMAKAVTFTEPLFYAGMSPIVRSEDNRFDNNLDRLNQADVTFVTQEGNVTDHLTRQAFPKAKFYTLPPNASGSEYYQAILAKKGDAVISDRNALHLFTKNNGDVLKMIAPQEPIKIQSFAMVVGLNELALKNLLDLSIQEMNFAGENDRLLKKWEPEPGKTYLRSAHPFTSK